MSLRNRISNEISVNYINLPYLHDTNQKNRLNKAFVMCSATALARKKNDIIKHRDSFESGFAKRSNNCLFRKQKNVN